MQECKKARIQECKSERLQVCKLAKNSKIQMYQKNWGLNCLGLEFLVNQIFGGQKVWRLTEYIFGWAVRA